MRKKVLFIVQNLPVPQDRRIMAEAETLSKNGWQISIVAPGNDDQKEQETLKGQKLTNKRASNNAIQSGPILFYRYPKAPQIKARLKMPSIKPPKLTNFINYFYEYFYSFIWTLYLTLKVYFTRGFSVIHIANPPDFFFVIAGLFKFSGVRFIWDQHDLMPEMAQAKFNASKTGFLYKTLVLIEKLALKTCDLHLVTCASAKSVTSARHQFKAPTVIVKNAVDFSKVYTNTPQKRNLKKVNQFKYLGVYLGVMGHQDGLDKLLKSIQYVVSNQADGNRKQSGDQNRNRPGRDRGDQNRTDIGFILMGDGDAFLKLKRQARKLKINQNVIFTGWADSQTISTYLNIADIGLMPEPRNPYTNNSLHNKVLEYMAAGLPIVAYDLAESKKAVQKAGVFVKNNDEKEFARSIIKLIDNPAKRKAMSRFAQKRVRENFSWESSGRELMKGYEPIFSMI